MGLRPQRFTDAELLTALDKAIDALKEYPNWTSVDDDLPDEGQLVMAVRDGCKDMGLYKFMGLNPETLTHEWEWHPHYIVVVDDITHWMPQPELPKGGEQCTK